MTAKRIVIAIVASVGCCWAVWQAARAGLARTLGEYAVITAQAGAANEAVTLSPTDAETHYARGVMLQASDDNSAQLEFERAVQIRPRDYYLWVLLGMTRDQNQDQEGALHAFRQSVTLAPAYAQPHWQLGNLLLRMGQTDSAFAELRTAASSDPALVPNVIDLAWGIYGDAAAVVDAVQPRTDNARMALAIFFAQHNEGAAAIEQLRLTNTPSETKAEALVNELLRAKAFGDAYQVWARMHGLSSANALGVVLDGGFENAIGLEQSGFGWQITPNIANVTMSVDPSEHQSGARSLRIDFRGNSEPSTALLTQLVLVKPQTLYRLSFAALSREFVSAAPPVVTITDASDPKIALAQSPPLRADGWQSFPLEFNTSAQAQAITISVARQSCTNNPCPAFGTLWLDSFSIEAADRGSSPTVREGVLSSRL